jgi:hypothetical protein
MGLGTKCENYTAGCPNGAVLKYVFHTPNGQIRVHDNDYMVIENMSGLLRFIPEHTYCSDREEFIDHLLNDCDILVTCVDIY